MSAPDQFAVERYLAVLRKLRDARGDAAERLFRRRYERATVQIADGQGMRADAHVYCMRPPLAGGLPSDAYFDLMTREYCRLGIDPEPLVLALERAASAPALARRSR